MNSFGKYFSRETFYNGNNLAYMESYGPSINIEPSVDQHYYRQYNDSSSQPNEFTKDYVIEEIDSPNEVCSAKQRRILPEIGEFLREENYRKKGINNDDMFYNNIRCCHFDNFGSPATLMDLSKLSTSDPTKSSMLDENILKDNIEKESSLNKNSLKSPSSDSIQFHYLENKKIQKCKNDQSDFLEIPRNGKVNNCDEESDKVSFTGSSYSTLRYSHFWSPTIDDKFTYGHINNFENPEIYLFNTKSLELPNNFDHKSENVNLTEESHSRFPSTHDLVEDLSNNKITTVKSEKETLPSTSDIMDGVDWSSVDCSCLEQMEKRYQNEAIRDLKLACTILNLPPDPLKWKVEQVHKWLMWTTHQCSLPLEDINFLGINGEQLCSMTEDKMRSLAPRCGDILHARLEIWRAALRKLDLSAVSSKKHDIKILPMKEKVIKEETATIEFLPIHKDLPNEKKIKLNESIISKMTPNHTGGIQLWQFLKELLNQPKSYEQCIRWINKERGIFKIEDSVRVARLWGVRKNRPAMNYDKLSRSIRQYYKKGIIRKTDVSQRLVYQFVKPNG